MKRIQRLRRNESGMSYVFIGLSMMAFISASMLAIDVGMLMTARSQAQNSADAGALAGRDRARCTTASPTTRPVDRRSRVRSAPSQLNNVMGGPGLGDAGRRQFLTGPVTGQQDRVKVTVRRTASRGNPLWRP